MQPRTAASEQGRTSLRAKIKACGGAILSWLFKLSKIIALATVMFLISASVDRVPDSPELLSSGSGSAISLQFVHHNVSIPPQAVHSVTQSSGPQTVSMLHTSDLLLAVGPSQVLRSSFRATDPSPPSVQLKALFS